METHVTPPIGMHTPPGTHVTVRARLDGISDSVSLVNNRAPDPEHLAEVVADLRR